MALPFIAGLAVGAGVALAFTKRKQIQEKLNQSEIGESIQKGLSGGLDKGKEISNKALSYAKDSICNTTQNLKEKFAKDDTKQTSKTESKAKSSKPRKQSKTN